MAVGCAVVCETYPIPGNCLLITHQPTFIFASSLQLWVSLRSALIINPGTQSGEEFGGGDAEGRGKQTGGWREGESGSLVGQRGSVALYRLSNPAISIHNTRTISPRVLCSAATHLHASLRFSFFPLSWSFVKPNDLLFWSTTLVHNPSRYNDL